VCPKIRDGGWIAGDDFSDSIWQHDTSFEPTFVFPFAVNFAEAVDARIFALPHDQFLLEKSSQHPFAFIDLTGAYGDIGLWRQLHVVHPSPPLPPLTLTQRIAGHLGRLLARTR